MLEGVRRVARGESDIDFVGRIKLWFIISAVVLAASVFGLTVTRLDFGLAFEGGTSLRAPLNTDVKVADIRSALTPQNLGGSEIQVSEGPPPERQREVLVQSKHLEPDQLAAAQTALAKVAGLSDENLVSIEDVGPKWGRQVSNKALQGLIVFLVLVMIYISFRFEPKMAVGAVIALFHDMIVTAGFYALAGFEVSPATVVALLTILGYSLYDTVVIYDKIKENTAQLVGAKTTFAEMVNKSLNQVTMRSINTSLTSLIPVAALLIVGQSLSGAQQMTDLALALFIGIFVGTYSSVFLAAPLLAVWKEREPRYQALKVRAQKEAGKTPAFAAAPAARSSVASPAEAAEPASAPAPQQRAAVTTRPAGPKPRKKRRGKRKR